MSQFGKSVVEQIVRRMLLTDVLLSKCDQCIEGHGSLLQVYLTQFSFKLLTGRPLVYCFYR
jgi:hypothetical protein